MPIPYHRLSGKTKETTLGSMAQILFAASSRNQTTLS